jgi:type III pantothenate kinase
MILAIDAGNTRIKWGVHDGLAWVAQGSVPNSEAVRLGEAWRGYAAPHRIAISNVAGEKIASELTVLLKHWHTNPVWIEARATECGVSNNYDNPVQLGSDRWAALIGARAICSQPCLVATLGTAVTVDALTAEGLFLGGIIMPGIALMHDVLARRTASYALQHAAQLHTNVSTQAGNFRPFPSNTADAVHSGCLQALAGAVERMATELAKSAGQQPQAILSGGDAELLQPLLNLPVQLVDNLVLQGLLKIAQQENAR